MSTPFSTSLCHRCRRGAVVIGDDGRERVYCDAMGAQTIRVGIAVRECSRFETRHAIDASALYTRAWLIDLPDATPRVAGFTPPDERSAQQDRAVLGLAMRLVR